MLPEECAHGSASGRMVSFRRRRNACRLSLRPRASSARARSLADHVRSAVDFNECDLVAGPAPRRGAVDAECCNPSTILDQRRADKRGSVACEQLLALGVRESRICSTLSTAMVSPRRQASTIGLAEAADRAAAGERRDPVRIGAIDDEIVSVDVGEVDAAGVEMFADETDSDFLNRNGIFQRPQVLVERDQEVPLRGHSRRRF